MKAQHFELHGTLNKSKVSASNGNFVFNLIQNTFIMTLFKTFFVKWVNYP